MSSDIARTEGAVRTVLKISQKSEIGDLVVQIATWFISRPDTLLQSFSVFHIFLNRLTIFPYPALS